MKSFFLLFALLYSAIVYSDSLVIGVEKLNYLPYYTYEKNEYKGYARELFDQFGKDSGHTIHYKILPVARLFHEFVNNTVDFKFPDNQNWKKQDKQSFSVKYSSPVIGFTDGIMVLPQSLSKDESDFKHIGTMRGFTPWILQAEIEQKSIEVHENNTLSGLLKQVRIGRIDGCFVNIDVARYYLNNKLKEPDSLVLNTNLPNTSDSYYLSTINHPEILQEFNQWLKNNSTFHQELKNKWGL